MGRWAALGVDRGHRAGREWPERQGAGQELLSIAARLGLVRAGCPWPRIGRSVGGWIALPRWLANVGCWGLNRIVLRRIANVM